VDETGVQQTAVGTGFAVPAHAVQQPGQGPGHPRRRRVVVGTIGALGALGIAAGAVVGVQAAGGGGTTTVVGQASPALQPTGWRGGYGGYGTSGGYGYPGGTGTGTGSGTGTADSAAATGTATSSQQIGVVDIDTVLGYENGEAAGTGMVLTSSGEILTNNHVVDGATKITVTVVATGTTYPATVVGTDPTDDVAVIQLSGASGLQTAHLASGSVQVGTAVTAVGNAGGTGGTPSAAPGTVVALGQSITATDDSGANAEQLTGLIETDADVQAGDSGGPLFDSSGAVVGMDTAASSGGQVQGYAIPIAKAVSVAKQIESGVDDATIHQGLPAFLGVSVSPSSSGGAAVAGVLSGGPAEDAGLAAGDVVTTVGGTTIGSAGDLTTALQGYQPGQRVTITWTATDGASHSATVTLASGPAD
jgi:S1-C subfamily serine protease